eukprot:318022-Rhodomonas_salina.5
MIEHGPSAYAAALAVLRRARCNSATCLRACYAMSGTDIPSGTTRTCVDLLLLSKVPADACIVSCAIASADEMCGTEIAYGSAVCGTEIAETAYGV